MDGAAFLPRARSNGWQFDLPDPAPLGALLRGKSPEQAAQMLPRLFNLCAAAQGLAARLSLGLNVPPDTACDLARDVLRDHLLALFVTLPRALGLAPAALPAGWQDGSDIVPALWGGPRPVVLADWLAGGRGLAPLLSAVQTRFGAQGRARDLPVVGPATIDAPAPVENSPAARHMDETLLRQAQAKAGRGPLWRVLGRLCDAEAAAQGVLPAPVLRDDGMALVPAARGVYGLRLTTRDGHVAGICRVTPTDRMLAPGGMLRTALADLRDPALAPLLLAIHDPCMPVTLTGPQDA